MFADCEFLFFTLCVCVRVSMCVCLGKGEVVCSENSKKEDTEEAKPKLFFEVLSRLMLLWAGYFSSVDTF